MSWNIDPAAKLDVLLPFDFSSASYAALPVALRFAGSVEQLYVLHVVPELETASPGFLAGQLDPKRLLEHAGEQLAKAVHEGGAANAQLRVHMGDPASDILDTAREVGADLIVIPSQGKTGLARWMMGSVAERVVRRARCPVLVLPITPEDA